MQRCAVLCPGFAKHEGAAGKIERGQTVAAREFCLWRAPVEPAGNHQVQNEPEVASCCDRDSLADSPEFAHDTALRICEWRLRGSKQERARQSNAFKRLREDAWFECSDVGGDIRQFRHAYQLAGCACGFATSLFTMERNRRPDSSVRRPTQEGRPTSTRSDVGY